MRGIYKKLILLAGILCGSTGFALTFDLPPASDDLIGQVQNVHVGMKNIVDIMQKYDVGYLEMQAANPDANLTQLSSSQILVVPTEFLLPDAPRTAIVVNVGEMRLYYYEPDQGKVLTFPVGIGKEGRMTPLGKTYVVDKATKPEWNPTPQVRDDFLRINGYPLPQIVMPGPDNPLGDYSMSLGFPTILIHGSIDPSGIGQRSSAGCIRMFNQDIGSFFPSVVPNHTQVMVVYQPFKAGWSGNNLYFEAHPPATTDYATPDYKAIINAVLKEKPGAKVDWAKAAQMAKDQTGVPGKIGSVG